MNSQNSLLSLSTIQCPGLSIDLFFNLNKFKIYLDGNYCPEETTCCELNDSLFS
jgi:hypothetical protein